VDHTTGRQSSLGLRNLASHFRKKVKVF
jgi:hypothetical protein